MTISVLSNPVLLQLGADLRTRFADLTHEVASGRRSDTKTALAGNFSYASDIKRGLVIAQGYRISATEAGTFLDVAQRALEHVSSSVAILGEKLLPVSESIAGSALEQGGNQARAAFETIIATLNVSAGGRSVFAGRATDAPPLADADTVLNGLEAAIAGAADARAALNAAETWFNDPAGFRALAYNGSGDDLAPMQLSASEVIRFSIRADDTVLGQTLMHAGLAAIADRAVLGFSDDDIREIYGLTSLGLLSNQHGVTGLRGQVGALQERAETMQVRSASEYASLEAALGELIGADPYEAAQKLKETEASLEIFYTMMSRLKNMSLVNYIR